MTCVDDFTLFAAADCTGHGVPGAMVSVVCSNAFNRAVRECGLTQPAEILDKTRELVIERFEKSEEEVKDGMDVALCALNPKTNELHYSGAQNPLWIVTKREGQIIDGIVPYTCEQENETKYYLHEIKPDKQPIGKYAETSPFHNHVIHLEPGDTFYVFTDGYADQFGGPRGKKYKYKPFKNLILGLQEKKMDAQHHELDWQFEKWRGELEQVDDVCIIGVRI